METKISDHFTEYCSTLPSHLAIIIALEGINSFLSLFKYIHNQEGTFTQDLSKLSLDDAILLVQKTNKYLEPPRANSGSFFQSYEIVLQQTVEKELHKISRKSKNKAMQFERISIKMDQPQKIKKIKTFSIDTSSQKRVAPKHKKKKGPDLLDKCLPGSYGTGKRR